MHDDFVQQNRRVTAVIDQRAYQCNRRRSLVLWRGGQWSVTSNGIETTDASVPHVVIPLRDFDRMQDILDGRYSPLLPHNASWFDRGDFHSVMAQAKIMLQSRSGTLTR